MITEQQVKKWPEKKKQTCSARFVKVLKFQEHKFKIIQNNF